MRLITTMNLCGFIVIPKRKARICGAALLDRGQRQLADGSGPAIGPEGASRRAVLRPDRRVSEPADSDSSGRHRDRRVHVDDTRPRGVLVHDA